MKLLFIRPANISITPAFDRVIESSDLSKKKSIVVIHWPETINEDIQYKNFKYINYIGKRNIKGYIAWFFFVFTNLKKEKPTHIHNFSFMNWFSICPFSFFRKNIKIFYDCRDYFAWSKSFSPFLKWAIRKLDCYFAKKSSIIIFPDGAGFQYFKTQNTKYKIIPNSVEDYYKSVKEELSFPKEKTKLKLAFLGYTSTDRNIGAILKAVQEYSHLELHIASNLISKNIETKLRDQKNVIFHGKLNRKSCINLLSQCHYCLITYNPQLKNYQYIQPTKFYDSLMANVPYVCSKGMFALEAYTGRDWPNVAIEYDNIDAIGNLPFPDSSIKNRELYESKYQYDIIIEQLGNIYKKFLNT